MTPKHVAHAAQSTPGVQVASLTVGHHNAQCVRAVEERLFVRNNVGMPETGQHGCLWPVVQTACFGQEAIGQSTQTHLLLRALNSLGGCVGEVQQLQHILQHKQRQCTMHQGKEGGARTVLCDVVCVARCTVA